MALSFRSGGTSGNGNGIGTANGGTCGTGNGPTCPTGSGGTCGSGSGGTYGSGGSYGRVCRSLCGASLFFLLNVQYERLCANSEISASTQDSGFVVPCNQNACRQ